MVYRGSLHTGVGAESKDIGADFLYDGVEYHGAWGDEVLGGFIGGVDVDV